MTLLTLLLSLATCLLSGYLGGFDTDKEISFLDYDIRRRFRKVHVSTKWKKLFRFYYLVPNEAYLSAFIVEASGVVFSSIALLYYIVTASFDLEIELLTFFFIMGCHAMCIFSVIILYGVKCHRLRKSIIKKQDRGDG